jgi:hypothetical protein
VRWFVVLVSLVLLLSLLLKVQFVFFDAAWTLKSAFAPSVVVASIALESSILVFLYSTKSLSTKLLSILILFLTYSAISVYSLLRGTSCNCFGATDVSPVAMLIVNGLIASIAVGPLLFTPSLRRSDYLQFEAVKVIRAVAVFVTVFLGTFVSSKAGIRQRTGQLSLIVQQIEDVKVAFGKETVVVFHVSNPNRFPIKIVGHKLSCSCLRNIKYPTAIGSKGNATIQIQFTGDSLGPVDKNFRLFFSGVGLNVVSVSINGHVMPKEST